MAYRHGHGLSGKPSATYRTWNAMRQRCENPKSPKYATYGGAGVTVCERWLDFANFLTDMGERPAGMTIDRLDGSKGYAPENCRWASPKQQQRNIRSNREVTIGGETKLLCEWAEQSGIQGRLIMYRIGRGWPDDKILSVSPTLGNRVARAECFELDAFGERLPLSEWAARVGVKPNTIRERLRRGVPPETALASPLYNKPR